MKPLKKIAYYPVVFCVSVIAFFITVGLFCVLLCHNMIEAFYTWLKSVFYDFKLCFMGILFLLCGGEFYKYPAGGNKSEPYKGTFRGTLDNDFI